MKQVIVEIDDETADELERVAPARSRQRSEFIRHALRKALWDEEERRTREAYLNAPDRADDAYVDAGVWEQAPARRRKTAKR
jgi:predicted transcriptional regulator